MAEAEDNPLVKALPPETDYLTYLTIIEYNLDKTQLPLLHELLQDTTLTNNIGWDLVSLLLPLLPESEQCLQDVAFLGNPREAVLKVAELLEEIGRKRTTDDEDEEYTEDEGDEPTRSPAEEASKASDQLIVQFQSLLHMLCILHPRIRTQHPSRFLVTSLQAVIAAYKAVAHLPSSVEAILMLVKSLSGSKRPHLPPRKSQPAIPMVSARMAAPDPEAQVVVASKEEDSLKIRILRSFMTHVIETYVLSIPPVSDSSPFAWSNRFLERQRPDRIVPHRQHYGTLFKQEVDLERRDATISRMLNSVDADLTMPWTDLLHWVCESADTLDPNESAVASPTLPLSEIGALFLLAAKAAYALLNDRLIPFPISLFPQHEKLAEQFFALDQIDSSTFCAIDGVIILGWAAFELIDGTVNAETRTEFNNYLHRISFVSANLPLPALRYQAHMFASAVLHGNPSSETRLDFIQDTLEYCPFLNLKVSAIGWLKEETLMAFDLPLSNSESTQGLKIVGITSDISNAFAQPEALKLCAPWLFATPDTSSEEELGASFPFWLAVLNFYYLLCSSPLLYKALDLHRLAVEFNIERDFVEPLVKLVEHFKGSDKLSDIEGEAGFGMEICALEDALSRLKRQHDKMAGRGPSN